VSGAGLPLSKDEPRGLVQWLISRVIRVVSPGVFEDKQRERDLLLASDLDWTLLRPPRLVDGSARGYVFDDRAPATMMLTRADLAAALLEEVTATTHRRAAPFVACKPRSWLAGARPAAQGT
jgi:hypothetical protein